MSGEFLDVMARSSRARLAQAVALRPRAQLERAARATPPPPPLKLSGFDLIAELKLRSPAQGQLRGRDEDVAGRVRAYAQAGAAAVSVLTEPERFDGSLEHLQSAAAELRPLAIPAMRKDFLVDPYQVLEARAAGAGGILVILRMLERPEIDGLIACAQEHGLFVLLEAFDAADIELLHELTAQRTQVPLLAGVNCRDLRTLQVVPGRLLELAPLLPRHVPCVAESGVATAADARAVAAAGYQLALVGSALMSGADPRALGAALLDAGRAAQRSA